MLLETEYYVPTVRRWPNIGVYLLPASSNLTLSPSWLNLSEDDSNSNRTSASFELIIVCWWFIFATELRPFSQILVLGRLAMLWTVYTWNPNCVYLEQLSAHHVNRTNSSLYYGLSHITNNHNHIPLLLPKYVFIFKNAQTMRMPTSFFPDFKRKNRFRCYFECMVKNSAKDIVFR